MRVKICTPEMFPALVPLMIEFHKEHEHLLPSALNIGKAARYVGSYIEDGKVFVVETNEGIVGSIALKPIAYWFSDEQFLQEGWFYVHPSARRSRAAPLLIKAAKEYAQELDLRLQVGLHLGDEGDRKGKFLERNGFAKLGGVYSYSGE